MTSKQVMLTRMAPTRGVRAVLCACLAFAVLATAGCGIFEKKVSHDPLESPYQTRRVWAVTPLLNESGSAHADSYKLADDLIRQLESASNIDVLPLNRVLAAMQAMRMPQVGSPAQAQQLMQFLGADGLVAGTITAYDPYDPPKLGMAIELYTSGRLEQQDWLDVRRLSTSPTDPRGEASGYPGVFQVDYPARRGGQPVSIVSAVLDANHPEVVRMMKRYAASRSRAPEGDSAWHRYRISMDLYSDFASFIMSWRLLKSEESRLWRHAQAIQKAKQQQERAPR